MTNTSNASTICFPDTYGLVLCGGSSTRMGTDKSMLTYQNKPQRYLLYDVLMNCCEDVFISCNSSQKTTIDDEYTVLQDDEQYSMIGPMGALMTAIHKFPLKNILLIACDYPFLTTDELQSFSTVCKDSSAAFYNANENLYVPVLAWYSCKDFEVIIKLFKEGKTSLQQCLYFLLAKKYIPKNDKCILSVDTMEMYLHLTSLKTNNSIE